MSWITIDDLSNMFLHGIESNISGTYNAVGDLPVNSKEFAKAYPVNPNGLCPAVCQISQLS
ncbi:MAG: hypothetical protein IPI15_16585 [Saprospiraceae bacterium]|uniref:hypothetical protein n=1 Tax=Candidatus Brachybacter algidus TaxID=2982024 RepID=UPI00257BCAF2|nr:hypothetical protein [Candidatus Brachybacter algidus]MBK7605159.1 hypothetical protein [Candidatus Brachybacter algidus]